MAYYPSWEAGQSGPPPEVALLVRARSIFPWLVRVVSDRSVRYNEKHPAALPEIKKVISMARQH